MTTRYQNITEVAIELAIEAGQEAYEFAINNPDKVAIGLSGFAWVGIRADRRTSEGKELAALGIRWDDYRKQFRLSAYDLGANTQFIEPKEKACEAAAKVLRDHGFHAHAFSNLD